MQIQYSAVAAGNGSNPKAPPPVSNLLRQYIIFALRVQEGVDELQEDPTDLALRIILRSNLNIMLDLYNRMSAEEQNIVENSHVPPRTARALRLQVTPMLETEDATILAAMASDLSIILYYNQTINVPCSLH